jgi:putative transposase
VFNDAVSARRAAYEAGAPFPTDGDLSRALTAAKRTLQRAWLAEVSAVVLQQALAEANAAYRNFFASRSGKRKGRKLGAPRFRSRKDRRQSIRFTKAARFRVTDAGRLRLPGVGDVAVRWSRELPGEASSVTVTVDAAGRYHASFVVQVPAQPLPPANQEVGIDLGLVHFAVLSDGRKVDNPRHGRKAAAKLRRAQKELARRQRGSANREKARRKVAKCHARVGDTRRDWLQAVHHDHPREPSGVRGGPRSVRVGPHPARPQRQRCGLVDVRGDAGVQGGAAQAHVRQGRPLVPIHPGMLGVRGGRGTQAAAGAGMGMPLWRGP